MCVVELSRILEAKSKQAIHSDVSSPDQPVREQPKLVVKDPFAIQVPATKEYFVIVPLVAVDAASV